MKNKALTTASLCLAVFLFLTGSLSAHALHIAVKEGHAVTLRAQYGDGEAMRYGEVKVFAPGENTLEYQKGRTDAEGRFAFIPSQRGDWTMEISDGMGHKAVKSIKIDSELKASSPQGAGFTLVQKTVMVLVIFWGAAGTVLFFQRRK